MSIRKRVLNPDRKLLAQNHNYVFTYLRDYAFTQIHISIFVYLCKQCDCLKIESRHMNRIFITIILLLNISIAAEAKNLHKERYYQDIWCLENNGQTEVVLPDRTRCDCLTATHVIEFDFGKKWAEAIGQSLYYSIQTGKRAGVALILEKPSDYKYWIRLNTVIAENNLKIDTWQIRPGTARY